MIRPVNSSTICDLAVHDDVVVVSVIERLSLHRLGHVVDELCVSRVVEVLDAERMLDRLDRGLSRRDGLELLVELVVGPVVLDGHALGYELRRHRAQLADDPGEVVVHLRGRLRLARDDQRRARLVDQDRVDLVDDRVPAAALNTPLERRRHVVAEVIEAELRVRAVGDVRRVGLPSLDERHHVPDEPRTHAERLVTAPSLGVALGEVVVDGHEVDALARKRVQVERHGRDEGLPLSGLHLRDIAFVEDDRAHQLHVERPQAERAASRLSRPAGLEDERVELLAVFEPPPNSPVFPASSVSDSRSSSGSREVM